MSDLGAKNVAGSPPVTGDLRWKPWILALGGWALPLGKGWGMGKCCGFCEVGILSMGVIWCIGIF